MSTPTTQPPQLPAAIQGKFNLTLTENKFQALADEASSLVYNEDNLEKIKSFLDKTRKVEKAISQTHSDGKAEALKIGRDWDAGKNLFLATVEAIKTKPQQEYTKICQDIEKRQREQDLERERIKRIKEGIESNAILFAKQIADCTTTQQLTDVERKVNLEKTRKDKYAEFLEEATTRFSELNSILAAQKVTVKELEENKRQQEEAKKKNDDAALLLLKEQQEKKEAQIEENKTVVQEAAIAQSVNAAPVSYATEVIPKVSARRTTWDWEVINEKEVMKKNPEFIIFKLDDDKVKANLKLLKDTNQLDGKSELVINGIRFFEKKSY